MNLLGQSSELFIVVVWAYLALAARQLRPWTVIISSCGRRLTASIIQTLTYS